MKNAIIRFCAIVALLGFGSEIRAARSGGHLFLPMIVFPRTRIRGNDGKYRSYSCSS